MSTKEKLYGITIEMMKVCNLPMTIYGFDIKGLIWREISKLTSEQANKALERLKDMVAFYA